MKLYVYDHCPYCVKARMIFGLKQVSFKRQCLLNDDEKSPKSMIGVKMVPILEIKKTQFMPESLDIISYIDKKYGQALVSWKTNKKLSSWLDKNSTVCYKLAMPRWIQAPLDEFKTKKARDYFEKKKSAYIGPFQKNLKHSKVLIEEIKEELKVLESFFDNKQQFFSGQLSIDDFHLFAFLRSLSIVKDLSFPPKIKHYSQMMSKKVQITLHHHIAL